MIKFKTTLMASVLALCAATAASAADLTVWGLQAFNKDADALIGQMAKDFGKARQKGSTSSMSSFPQTCSPNVWPLPSKAKLHQTPLCNSVKIRNITRRAA